MVRHPELTGRTRHRAIKPFWGDIKLVLQVEEKGMVTNMAGPYVETETVTYWRDATVADITKEGE